MPKASHNQAAIARNVTVRYGTTVAVANASAEIPYATLTAVIGPNGAGKSTFVKALLGLVPLATGEVQLLGGSPKRTRRRVAYVPQRSDVEWNFPITVEEVVLLGTYPNLPLITRPGTAERQLAQESLAHVGMEAFANRQISELSGGQQQRVFIARALAQQPELFVLDEPFAGIDIASSETIMNVLREQQAAGRGAIVVHHDLVAVRAQFSHAVLINKHVVHAGPVAEVFTEEHIGQAFAHNLRIFEAVQELRP